MGELSYSEAQEILISKLKELKLSVKESHRIEVEDVILTLHGSGGGYRRDYTEVGIMLNGIHATNIKRGLRFFNVRTGNYELLKQKILELTKISLDNKKLKENQAIENDKIRKEIVQDLKELNVKIVEDRCDDASVSLEISMSSGLHISKGEKKDYNLTWLSLPDFRHLEISKEELKILVEKVKDFDIFMNKIFQESKEKSS